MKKLIIAITVLHFAVFTLSAQDTQPNNSGQQNAIKIFLDCQFCDEDFIRREIPYINYVRDVNDAQLYYRETSRTTGSGGREYTQFFVGQDEYAGLNDTLIYSSSPDDTQDETRAGRTNLMKMGLMRYVARTPLSSQISITSESGVGFGPAPEEIVDKWNNWVFEIETRPQYSWESTRKTLEWSNSFSANKITETWKIENSFDHSYSNSEYELFDETITAIRKSMSFENTTVRSISPHWSVGMLTQIQTSTYNNYKFQATIYPSLEYNLYPYAESTHHQMRFLYSIGASLNHYNDTTIYNKTIQNLPEQKLQIAYEVQERWGSVNISLTGENYLKKISDGIKPKEFKYRVGMSGRVSVRIVRGLSVFLFGSVAKVENQISLAGGGTTDTDVLLRLQEQATSYNISGNVGFTYTFGSIYNNIVNPRFGGGGGSGFGGGGGGGGGGGFRGGR